MYNVFLGTKISRRTTTRQRRNRVTTDPVEKILLPAHCLKMDTGITLRRQFPFFSEVKYVFACFCEYKHG